jgi:quinol monooxygenase YgiN
MVILHIEHAIHDFAAWKAAFERDPAGRRQSGVVRYWVRRPLDDANHISIDLEFAGADAAQKFVEAMQVIWASRQAAPALAGKPHTRIYDQVEYREY